MINLLVDNKTEIVIIWNKNNVISFFNIINYQDNIKTVINTNLSKKELVKNN